MKIRAAPMAVSSITIISTISSATPRSESRLLVFIFLSSTYLGLGLVIQPGNGRHAHDRHHCGLLVRGRRNHVDCNRNGSHTRRISGGESGNVKKGKYWRRLVSAIEDIISSALRIVPRYGIKPTAVHYVVKLGIVGGRRARSSQVLPFGERATLQSARALVSRPGHELHKNLLHPAATIKI